MADIDPFGQFSAALTRLEGLRDSVARQVDPELVFEAVQELQLAVTRCYGGRRPQIAGRRGAKMRILDHLKAHLGSWVGGPELAAVSGIGEWARRVRELRLELGYLIEEQDGMYRLLEAEPDVARARRWQTLNAIRRAGGTPRERILTVLSDEIGQIVRGADLSYVAGGQDALPVVRELRDGDCLPIDSAMDCRDLHGDEFRLLSVDPAERRDDRQHLFPEALRAQVFRRDDYSCWRCRRDRDAAAEVGEQVFYLQVGHLRADADELELLQLVELLDPSELATFCRRCLRDEQVAARRARRRGDAASDE